MICFPALKDVHQLRVILPSTQRCAMRQATSGITYVLWLAILIPAPNSGETFGFNVPPVAGCSPSKA